MHQSRVCPSPPAIPVGFYWYGGTRRSAGKVPNWVHKLLEDAQQPSDEESHTQTSEEPFPQIDSESDNEEQVDAGTSPIESESRAESANRQPSRYPLRARVAPPNRLY